MPDIISSLAPILQGATQAAGVGSTAYNLYNQYKNQQYQDQLRSYAQDPAKMNAYAAQFTQPLNAGLTTSVANNAQAYLAQRGLSESPQISQQVESQAIAPYVQQNQQQGYSDAINALGLGGGAIPPQLQQQNSIAALAKMFSQGTGAPGGLNGASALTRLLQLAQPGATGTPPQTQAPDMSGLTIPNQPTQSLDMSSFYQPDYATAGGGGDGSSYAESE